MAVDRIKPTAGSAAGTPIAFTFHPRVFAALGADLVTNDLVAVIELVKNGYDAFASRVDVRFLTDINGELCIEVEDNGLGMSDATIRGAWCMVATPFRDQHRVSERMIGGKKKVRRVTGAKGLGRLSVARLGQELEMLTREEAGKVWRLTVQWEDLAGAETIEQCNAVLYEASQSEFAPKSGTLLRIKGLRSHWSEDEIDELAEGLSRLKPPFEQLGDFKVFLTDARRSAEPAEIEPSELIERPVYRIKGRLGGDGTLSYEYKYQPYSGKGRNQSADKKWSNIVADLRRLQGSSPRRYVPDSGPTCGPFEFEVRAWDLDPDSMSQATERFNLRRSAIRSEIRAFKGIAVYRDQVLVLPKSETSRDWLGLDLRRISKTGTRISTSQIVGYVGITGDNNPKIVDTSDRERLARNDEVREFESLLQYVVEVLENKRDEDRPHEELHIGDLFEDLNAEPVIAEVQQLAGENAEAAEVLPYLERFSERLRTTKDRIERTFGYYNRLATIGTLSQMLVHEVGNNSVIIGRFISTARVYLASPEKLEATMHKHLASAETALQALERLADRFMPLASRGFKRGRRQASFKEALETCYEAREKDLERFEIGWETEFASSDKVKIDPGELHAVLLNLVDNAIYWLAHHDGRKRLRIETRKTGVVDRLECRVMDSGPGIEKGDEERIFLPGVTKRPNGFGMGLTVAAEIVEGHGGQIHVESPGDLKGASFVFDLPIAS